MPEAIALMGSLQHDIFVIINLSDFLIFFPIIIHCCMLLDNALLILMKMFHVFIYSFEPQFEFCNGDYSPC